jgi:hypothetical protein
MEIDVAKTRMEHIGLEGGDTLKPLVTTQVVEAMTKKSNQAKEQCQHTKEMYEALERSKRCRSP